MKIVLEDENGWCLGVYRVDADPRTHQGLTELADLIQKVYTDTYYFARKAKEGAIFA